ncbi:unnamed protein product [Ambrosiozyma monospora]|uniref:Unnamed protein product n=1 Tax=Ambrosiozyma monospora TaxID=43982 RepID=A0A9W7DET9_AMBMO|nr:unnamed protein product [Ambrosiozyma monospora]
MSQQEATSHFNQQHKHGQHIHNADQTFTKENSSRYENPSLRLMLKANCNAILSYDSSNQPPDTIEAVVGDYAKPEFGLTEEEYLLKPNDPDVSPIFKSKKPIKMLDFACGTGLLDYYLASYLPENSEIVGVDISRNQLDIFEKRLDRFQAKNPTLKVKLAEFDILNEEFNKKRNLSLPKELQENAFDLIICSISYHHFHDVKGITKKLKTYLKPQGDLIILDFYDGQEQAFPDDPDPVHAVAHHGGFSPEVLKSLFTEIGFSKVKAGISYKFNVWMRKDVILGHLPHDRVNHVINVAKTQYNEDRKELEYLVERSMSISVCTK